jgi:hypothetical protein
MSMIIISGVPNPNIVFDFDANLRNKLAFVPF